MRPLRTTSALAATLVLATLATSAAASPGAMMCSEEQTLSEEIVASDLVVVGELTAVRKTFSGTMVNVEADFRVAQTLYVAGGAAAKGMPTVTVSFACDSAPIPENLVGYPSVANYCDSQTGMPKTMPPQVSVLTLKHVDKKVTLVKRFVWGGCADLAELKKKSPHVAPLVAKIQALKLPAPSATAPVPTTVTGTPSPATTATATPTASATSSTAVPPVNTIAPAVTAPPPSPPPVPPKSSGCTVHTSGSTDGNTGPSAMSALLAVGLVFGGIARKLTRP